MGSFSKISGADYSFFKFSDVFFLISEARENNKYQVFDDSVF